MGEALRTERDREEAEWAAAVQRGTEAEVARGLGPAVARREAINNLGSDIEYYDRPERKEEAEWADAVRIAAPKIEMARGLGTAVARQQRRSRTSAGTSSITTARSVRSKRPGARSRRSASPRSATRTTCGRRRRPSPTARAYLPVVARARKAAEKVAAEEVPRRRRGRARRLRRFAQVVRVPVRVGDRSGGGAHIQRGATLARVRGSPAPARTAGTSSSFIPKGRDQDDAVASIDVDNYEVDEVRWLATIPATGAGRDPGADGPGAVGRLRRREPAARPDSARLRMTRRSECVEVPSPLQGFIDMMERRTQEPSVHRDETQR
jgi:hypothetical protein